jgi:hypothetical protein
MYVKDYEVGADDTVFKYAGAAQKEGYGIEAELDIQYIMVSFACIHLPSRPLMEPYRALLRTLLLALRSTSKLFVLQGPAAGVKTEFWELPGSDFCADLNQWTANLTSIADILLVHSVSCKLAVDSQSSNRRHSSCSLSTSHVSLQSIAH